MIASWYYLVAFATALAYVVILTRWLRVRGASWGLLDRPIGLRHHHVSPVPAVGGVGIAVSTVLALALLGAGSSYHFLLSADFQPYLVLVAGALAMHGFGVLDDLKEISPGRKLVGQTTIAIGVFLGGIRLTAFDLPGMGTVELTFWPSLLVTVSWLVAITNAFNLVDGADGVATGTALMAAVVLFVTSTFFGNAYAALLLAVLAGALLGFLYFNFPPASVFLGDGGSLFLGFLLAGLGIVGSNSAAGIAIAVPLLAFGLPITDTLLVIVRRTIRGVPIARADRRHIHHRLLELGRSPRQVAWIMYASCGMFGFASLLLLTGDARMEGLTLLMLVVAIGSGIRRLRLPEWREIGRSLARAKAHHRTVAPTDTSVRFSARLVARVELPSTHIVSETEAGPGLSLPKGTAESGAREDEEPWSLSVIRSAHVPGST